MAKRKVLSALCLILVGVLVFAGGQKESGESAEGEVVEITWLQWWVNEWGPDTHAALIDEFESLHPNISVTVVDVPWPDMATKLKADASGGGNKYDVLGMEIDWISGLVNMGYLEDLDPWLEKDKEFSDTLITSANMVYQGDVRGLALYLAPYQFAYNVDAYKELGIDVPTNWDEFVQAMKEIKQKGKYGISMTLQSGDFVANRYFAFKFAQLGGQYIDKNGKIAINSPAGIATFDFWKDFYAMDLHAPGSMNEDQSTSLELLATEKVLSIIDGPFILTKALQINPDIKLAYAPAWTDKTGGYGFNTSGISMNANTKHKDEAWELIKFMLSKKVSEKMTKTVSLPWATESGLAVLNNSDDPMLKYVPDFLNQDPEHTIAFPCLPDAERLVDELKLAFQEVLAGNTDSKTALDAVAAEWQKTIDEAGQ